MCDHSVFRMGRGHNLFWMVGFSVYILNRLVDTVLKTFLLNDKHGTFALVEEILFLLFGLFALSFTIYVFLRCRVYISPYGIRHVGAFRTHAVAFSEVERIEWVRFTSGPGTLEFTLKENKKPFLLSLDTLSYWDRLALAQTIDRLAPKEILPPEGSLHEQMASGFYYKLRRALAGLCLRLKNSFSLEGNE